MRGLTLLCLLAFLCPTIRAQYVYTIKADSVKITGCDSAELILENHTQNVPGFLFNTGNGRTIFKRGVQRLTDTSFLIGADTMTLPNAWVQGGNRFGDTGILGTMDNYPVDLYSNGTRQVRLSQAGNLLVGTTQEVYGGYKTQIAGKSWWGQGNGQIIINPVLSAPGDIIQLGGYLNTGDGQDAVITTSSDGGGSFTRVLVERSGYIGLGSSAPTGWWVGNPNIRIDVNGTVSFATPVMVYGNTNGPWNASGLMTTVSNTNEWAEADGYPNGQNYYFFGTVLNGPYSGYKRAPLEISADKLLFYAGPSSYYGGEAGRFAESGNFLLGSTTDDSIHKFQLTGGMITTGSVRFAGLTQDNTQTNVLVSDANGNLYTRSASSLAAGDLIRSSLTVNGPIESKSIIISPDVWADYVFDSTYRLKPLSEVASYLRQEHHLPDIPSAAEIKSQGLDVGAGQAALLKKIEELTLYNIDQQKKLDDQNRRLEDQNNRLEDQHRRLDEQNRRLGEQEKRLALLAATIEEMKQYQTP